MREIRVGFDQLNYNGARNTYAAVPGVTYKRAWRIPTDRLPSGPAKHAFFIPAIPASVDLLHTWNRISLGLRPWGVSFEQELPREIPRTSPLTRLTRKRLEDPSCRFLIALSDFAKRVLLDDFPESDEIKRKLSRVYPHQPKMSRSNDYVPPSPDQPLELLFIGGDFFRKGGEALLRVMESHGAELNLRLTCVSRVAGNDLAFATGGMLQTDVGRKVESIRERLRKHERIRWISALNQSDVFDAMTTVHIGVLPTLADTFGYVLLEFLALGTPVIGTNVQAQPEFVDDRVGWVARLPVDELGFWVGARRSSAGSDDYEEALAVLEQQLCAHLLEARNSPEDLARRSGQAVSMVSSRFDPTARGETMRGVYEQALG